MKNLIGIRHEDKYLLERRTPLTPKHVAWLIRDKKLNFVVQRSPKRIFTEKEYLDAGAHVEDNLGGCSVILGVKEIPLSFFEPEKTYVFFSHAHAEEDDGVQMQSH
jgi:saccharopine dehydrogenase (NAD+, L-lysine forming)